MHLVQSASYAVSPTRQTHALSGMVKSHEHHFISLVAQNQGIIHKVCHMYAHNEDDRQDLFQEITLQLWRSFKSFKGDSKLSTWMYRVALNTAISGFRKKKRRGKSVPLSTQEFQLPADEVNTERAEQLVFLKKAIQELSEVERALIMLYLEEHSYEEIADIMGITKNHVGVKLNRIKHKLKNRLTPHFS
ncbi:MAG: sigma-70 family RNA polymerase sigma factor [Bacteroidota bacterium]